MNPIRRQHAYSVYGPRSSPLYYTTLSRLPRRLVYAGLAGDGIRTIVLTSADPQSGFQCSVQARPVNGVCVWPLSILPTPTESPCSWRIEEQDWTYSETLVKDNRTQAPPPREGRFRVLDEARQERFVRGRERLQQVSDGEVVPPANALLMADLGLYHEALALAGDYVKHHRGTGLLLARTVQALIYKQMLRQIEQEQDRQSDGARPLAWYITWTQNRERYHRELTVDLIKGRCPRRCFHEVSATL